MQFHRQGTVSKILAGRLADIPDDLLDDLCSNLVLERGLSNYTHGSIEAVINDINIFLLGDPK